MERINLRCVCRATIVVLLLLAHDGYSQWTRTNGPQYVYEFLTIGTRIFAGSNGGGVFVSSDSGATWTAVNSGLPDRFPVALAARGNEVFAGTLDGTYRGLYRCADYRDVSWIPADSGLANRIVFDLTVSDSNIFAGTANGVFRCTRSGGLWTDVSSNIQSRNVSTLLAVGNTVFAGHGMTSTNGVSRSTNLGTSWATANSGLTNAGVMAFARLRTDLIAGIIFDGVFRSTNNGDTWTNINGDLPNSNFRALVLYEDTLIVATSGGAFVSKDMGAHWSNISSGLPPEDIKSLGIVGRVLVAGTQGGGTYRRNLSDLTPSFRTDSLNGWQFIGAGSLDTVYTRLSDTASAGAKSQLFGWSTKGNFAVARWEKYLNRSYAYPESIKIDVRCEKMEPSVNRTIGIDFGFLHNDTLPCQWGWGTPDFNWHTYTIYRSQCTLHPVAINRLWLTLQFFPSDTSAHGGAGEYLVDNLRFYYGSGPVVVDGFGDPPLAVATMQNLPTGFWLEQNYPNPFNPGTKIQFTIVNPRLTHGAQNGGQGQLTIVKVYDMLGQEVSTLVNEVKEPGAYTVQFDASGLASGVYLYRLTAGRYVETRKMILIR